MTQAQVPTLAGAPASAWERLARLVSQQNGNEVTADQVREEYVHRLQTAEKYPRFDVTVERPKPHFNADGSAHLGPYQVDFGIGSISLEGDFNPGPPWSADIRVDLNVIGVNVWNDTIHLSDDGAYVSLHPNVGVAKADVTIGVFGSNYCLRTYGRACYWRLFSWSCADYDETLYCFG
ncbi:hypothetical protein [Streptomyces sp. NPDC004658]|uniref:hypothetical protein n=1 Tax=Streptomyces sp. NPDC004658 TaxID=3154672 RepID=UPI0033BCE959